MLGEIIADSIAGNAIDKVVDTAVDSIKEKNTLNNTFVWTAINKETHGGQTANIIFINKLGQRRRVQYEQLVNFCTDNYVSNIVINDSKPSMVSITFHDLPNYILKSDGSYNLVGKYSEQDIYNKALAYIQSQERKIAEDIQNGCLKGNKQPEKTQSNITENLENAKDLAVAGAVTAITTAGVAAAGGIGLGVNAIYRKINEKKLSEVQYNMYKQLSSNYSMIEALIKVKDRTNDIASMNKYTNYSNQMEIDSCTNDKTRNLLRQYSMKGCIDKLTGLIAQCKANATTYKILDVPVKDNNGKKLGTLNSYITSTESRLNYLKHLHDTTRLIIEGNRNEERQRSEQEQQRIYIEQQQNQLKFEIDNDICALEKQIGQWLITDINVDNAFNKKNDFERLGIEQQIDRINSIINQLIDSNEKFAYQNRVNYILNNKLVIEGNINNRLNENRDNTRREIVDKINDIENSLEQLILGRVQLDKCQETLSSINSGIMDIRIKLQSVDLYDKDMLLDKLESVNNRLTTNKRQIENGISSSERDQKHINNIKSQITKSETEIENLSKPNELKLAISNFTRMISTDLNSIKNTELLSTWQEEIRRKTEEFNNKLTMQEQKKQEQEALAEQLQQSLQSELDIEIKRVNEFIVQEVTKENLEAFKLDLTNLKDTIESTENLDRTFKSSIKRKISDLEYNYNKKYREAERLLDSENSAIISLKSDIAELKIRVNSLGDSSFNTEKKINDSIIRLINSSKYLKLRNKTWIDNEINDLKTLLESAESDE
jgi:hypothetical protein